MKKNTEWALSWPMHANIWGKTDSKANGKKTFSLFSVVCLLGCLVGWYLHSMTLVGSAQYDFGWFCTVWLWLVGWCLCLCLHSMTGWLVGIFAYACTVPVWLSTTMDSLHQPKCAHLHSQPMQDTFSSSSSIYITIYVKIPQCNYGQEVQMKQA